MSATATSPYFGRAWKITLTSLDDSGQPFGEEVTISNSNWLDEALRVEFETEIHALSAYSSCDLTIWNANAPTTQKILKQGDQVSISAGYQANFNEDTNLIWKGRVFQPMFDRVDVVDYKVKLRCLIGFFENNNIVSFAQGPYATQAQIVQRIAAEAMLPIDQVDTATLSQTQSPRSQTVQGRPSDLLGQIADANGLAFFISPNGINIRSLTPTSSTPDFIFGPPLPPDVAAIKKPEAGYTPTLIGTPQQTQEGVTFRVLMDSRIKIGSLVKLDLSVVRQLPVYPGSYPPFLDQDGLYVVGGFRHLGDTRGVPWYTEIIGLTNQFWQLFAGVTQ